MGDSNPGIQVGNKVCFVGGPEAGNVRLIPESHGDHIQSDDGYIYRIWPMRITGDKQTAYFAYAADRHPLQMYMEMWREYAVVAQITRGKTEGVTYQKVGANK